MLAAVRAGGLRLAGAALLVASTFPVAVAVPAACAGEGSRAVLVVDTGESEHRMCVELPRPEVSGTDLIVLAGQQHGLSYRFGYGGGAVCMLAGVGAESDDCFEKYPDFWGYWRGDGSGGWSWSSSGAGSTRVSDGDVEGWSWGSGNDGSSHPQPPPTTFSSVCPARSSPSTGGSKPKADAEPQRETRPQRENEKKVAPQREPRRRAASARQTRVEPDERRGDAIEEARRSKRAKGRAERGRSPSPAADISADGGDEHEPALSSAPPPQRPQGPPPAGVAAIVAAGVLAGAGTWLTRRRRARP